MIESRKRDGPATCLLAGINLRECLITPASCCPATCLLAGRHENGLSEISAKLMHN